MAFFYEHYNNGVSELGWNFTSKTQKCIFSISRFKAIQTLDLLDLFQCNPSFGTGECISNQNLETLIFTFAPPLEQSAVTEVCMEDRLATYLRILLAKGPDMSEPI